ncbi:uncharacterized protein syt18b [Xyrichtys novacula]|uniref:Uncharacterized protein syt18b n=1 Tax=Xyrichtys novacula TaxID=13765 RepID=A0AAV1F6J3_XYRNO|nr:uncharacterized protein syt18b [Xyrichtys novacula]
MSYPDEEDPDQPLWQSVLLFCCKGMIEGIMVILFFWLLVQVLFTKQLEVHLQILLLVGLIVFCLCMLLGCFLCLRNSQICSLKQKDPVSPAFSQVEFPSLQLPNQAQAVSDQRGQQKSYFSLRRLSTPSLTAPLYKPIDHSHASLPTFPKLGLLAKTRKALQRRCTVTGSLSCDEHSSLTSSGAVSPSMPEPIPLAPLNYGSNAGCQQPRLSKPCLEFTMVFSTEQQTLAVSILSLTGTPHRLEDLSVLGSLQPLYPCPMQASIHRGLSPESLSLLLLLKVSSEKELQRCMLRIAVYTREPPSLRGSTLGEVEVECKGKDWRAENPLHFTKKLNPHKWSLRKSQISQDALVCKGLSCPPQIFIVLQYQTLAHRIKATVLRADNLGDLTHTSAETEYQVVINLHHEGVVISSRKTKATSCTVWNAFFLFDLPSGDIRQLPLMLEFVIMQSQVFSEGKVLGRVRIGPEATDAGQAHWRDMCSLQVEQARWHTVQPDV